MRRAPIVITATVVGTAGVLVFQPLPPSSLEGTSTAAGGSASPTPSASSGTPSASATGSATPSSTPSPSKSKSVSATVTGAVESDRYGDTQVRATIEDGRITDVTVLEYNDDDPRSAEISQDAAPLLRQEVLSKQTAAVDAVSGATYTSNAYEASLQSALDKAGFTASDGSKASTDLSSADADLRGH